MKKVILIVVLGFFLNIISNTSNANVVEELTKLNNLYKEGVINKEEFSKAKSILLKSEQTEDSSVKKNKKKPKEEEKIPKEENNQKKLLSNESRSFDEDLTETYVGLQDIEELGTFIKIDYSPEGLFHQKKHKSFPAKAKKSMQDMYLIFVKQKNLMEKYPENVMKAMAYFEFFYMEQLKKKNKSIEAFKLKYPKVPTYAKKDLKSLYSLNQARKSMRESMGLTLDDDVKEALDRYMTMSNLLSKAEKKLIKLTTDEKKLRKQNNRLKQNLSMLKKNIKYKKEKRIKDKDFIKEANKNIKKINSSLRLLTKDDTNTANLYKTLKKVFNKSEDFINKCSINCETKNLIIAEDSLNLIEGILSETGKNLIKKKYEQDMSKFDLNELPEDKKEIIGKVTKAMKIKKIEKNNNLQQSVLNLSNNGFEIDNYLDEIKSSGFDVRSVTMTFDNFDNMQKWAMKDWAESWRGKLPEEIKDVDGNLIKFTGENIEDIKAQLAMNTFKDLIDLDSLDLKESINDNIKEIAQTIQESGGFNLDKWLNQDFSVTLDNYSKLVGNSFGIDMNDFKDLTNFANKIYGTDISPDEYANEWESQQYYDSSASWGDITRGVELIDTVGSFDAAVIAKDLGTDLQQVADTIAQAAAVGVSTDLEAAAQGLGYGSFADAVAAYNAQYGTSYTAEEAAAALGN